VKSNFLASGIRDRNGDRNAWGAFGLCRDVRPLRERLLRAFGDRVFDVIETEHDWR
jgi:hypothetical protein